MGETEEVVRFKGTLVLFLIFAALGGYVYFSDFYNKEERQKQDEAKKKLFGGEAKDVVEITLEEDGKTITGARKGEKDWEITSPAGLEGDSDAWEQLASSFVDARKDEVVSAQKPDLASYGLDKPAMIVKAKLKKGDTPGILIGSENPKKTFRYAKRTDSDEVFLLGSSDSSAFKKSWTDLRNKKVLDFESDNIDNVRISASGKPDVEIQKVGMDWMLKKPVEGRGDNAEVISFLSAIQFSRASAFAEDNVDAKASGTDSPSAKVTLHDQKAGMDHTLLFGKSPEKGKFYAKDGSRTPIFILATEIIDKAQGPVFNWRDKSITTLGAAGTAGVDELEIAHGAEKISLKKTGTDWAASDGRKVQQAKVADILGSIQSERATSIVDSPKALSAYGLDKPRLEVYLRAMGKELAAIKIGNDSKDPDGVFLKSASPAVMTASKGLYDRLNIKWSDILEAQPAPAPPSK